GGARHESGMTGVKWGRLAACARPRGCPVYRRRLLQARQSGRLPIGRSLPSCPTTEPLALFGRRTPLTAWPEIPLPRALLRNAVCRAFGRNQFPIYIQFEAARFSQKLDFCGNREGQTPTGRPGGPPLNRPTINAE